MHGARHSPCSTIERQQRLFLRRILGTASRLVSRERAAQRTPVPLLRRRTVNVRLESQNFLGATPCELGRQSTQAARRRGRETRLGPLEQRAPRGVRTVRG